MHLSGIKPNIQVLSNPGGGPKSLDIRLKNSGKDAFDVAVERIDGDNVSFRPTKLGDIKSGEVRGFGINAQRGTKYSLKFKITYNDSEGNLYYQICEFEEKGKKECIEPKLLEL